MTNQDIDISMDNVVQYANQIRMPLDSWNKETQKQILSVMEAQRIASGVNYSAIELPSIKRRGLTLDSPRA